jgi:hypothetical protein
VAQDLLQHIVAAEHTSGLRLRLRFEDGVQGEVDLREVVSGFRGLLQALEDPAYVARVSVTDHGTIQWPNGVELDPIVLYCSARGIPVPTFEDQPPRRTPRVPKKRARAGRSATRATTVRRRRTGT